MTEEAFIRAVLDHPGQDTPRLVYADWLDDHGDGEPIDDGTPVTLYPLAGPDPDNPGVEEEARVVRGRLGGPADEPEQLDPATVAAHLGLVRVGWSEGRAVLLGVRGATAGTVYHPDVLGTDFPDPPALARSARGRTFSEFLARHTGLLPFWPPGPGKSPAGPCPVNPSSPTTDA